MVGMRTWLFGVFACTGLALSCTDSSLTDSTSSALVEAQCTYQSDSLAADDCFTAFDVCKAAEGADVAACLVTLKACLPSPHRHADASDGGGCHGHRGDGDVSELAEADGGVSGGHRGHHGRGGHHGDALPDDAAVLACRDALDVCLVAIDTLSQACFATARACERAAFEAAFAARCAEALSDCDAGNISDDDCTHILARCEDGVSEVSGSADGGTVCE